MPGLLIMFFFVVVVNTAVVRYLHIVEYNYIRRSAAIGQWFMVSTSPMLIDLIDTFAHTQKVDGCELINL